MPIAALILFAASLAENHADLVGAEERRVAVSVRCHIAPGRLVAEPGNDRSYVLLTVKGHAALNDAQLRCYGQTLAEVARVWPSLEDDRLGKRYVALISRDRLRAARADLRRRGLLAAVPRFDRRRETLEAFSVRIETLCGAPPRSVLIVREGWISLGDQVFDKSHSDLFDREECTREAATAAGFDPWTAHASRSAELSVESP
jgi:hypothetical protein